MYKRGMIDIFIKFVLEHIKSLSVMILIIGIVFNFIPILYNAIHRIKSCKLHVFVWGICITSLCGIVYLAWYDTKVYNIYFLICSVWIFLIGILGLLFQKYKSPSMIFRSAYRCLQILCFVMLFSMMFIIIVFHEQTGMGFLNIYVVIFNIVNLHAISVIEEYILETYRKT